MRDPREQSATPGDIRLPSGRSLRLGAILGFLSASGILLNLAYQWYVLTWVGPGRQTDALFAGTMVPQLMLAVVSGSLSYVMVPVFSTANEVGRPALAWSLFQGMALFWAAITVMLILLAPLWVPLTVPGFDASTSDLTVRLTRIQLLALTFTGVAGVEAAAYQARHRFVAAESAPLIAGLVGFAFVVWGLPRLGIAAAAWAMVIRSACQALLQIPALGRYHLPRAAPGLAEAWRRFLPLMTAASYYKADGFVDRLLASLAPAGALSLYHISLQLHSSAHFVLNRAITAPAVPLLARSSAAGNWSDFGLVYRRRLAAMLFITLGLIPVVILAGRPVLSALLQDEGFTAARVEELWWILVLLGGVWVGGAAGQVLSSSFYARGDTRTPTRIGVIGFTIAIGIKLLAFRYFGIFGLAAAASAYYLGNATALYLTLRRHLQRASRARGLEALASL